MKNPHFLSVFLYVITGFHSYAQNGVMAAGARPAAMGYTTATLDDQWSAFNNPGALGSQDRTMALFSYENLYGIAGLNNMAAGVLTASSLGVASISVFRFGDELFNEQNLSLGYGNTFGIASLGVRFNYRQCTLEGFGNRSVLTIDFGGIARINEEFHFGAFIRNINQARLADFQEERIPVLLNAGIGWKPEEKLILNIEVEKDIDFDASFKSGLEYNFLPRFSGRTGIRTRPFTNYFGLGFRTWKIEIDYALTLEQVLGTGHQVSLAYQLSK